MSLPHNTVGFAVFAALLQNAFATEWHVSPLPLADVGDAVQRRTIKEAAAQVGPGDRVVIHAGVYREAIVVAANGTSAQPIRFEAAPNAEVTITGADVISDWQDEGAEVCSVAWPHRFLPWTKSDAHPENEYHRLIGRPEQVMVDGYGLHHSLTRDALSRGSFFIDFDLQRLFISTPTGEAPGASLGRPIVEAATRSVLFECKGEYVQIRGVRFRHAANHAQQGAVLLTGRGDVLEDCIVELTSGVGAAFLAQDQVARRCTFQDNGALGIASTRAHDLLVSDCIFRNNTTKGFSRDWEAGGAKIVLSRNVVVERSQFIGNRGPGVWFDIGNEGSTVRHCFLTDNEGAGIFSETSYGTRAMDNVAVCNGLAPDPRAWGVQAGISISSSPDCVVQRNLLVGNREGISFREQRRTTARIGEEGEQAIQIERATITNNLIADNTAAQVGGWFDAGDERHWPRAMQESGSAGASLDQLTLRLERNLFAARDGRTLVAWGAPWRRQVAFSTLSEVQRELHLEQGSRAVPVQFANFSAHDFRLPADSPAFQMDCYPQGDVPGVMLGPLPREKGEATGDRLKARPRKERR